MKIEITSKEIEKHLKSAVCGVLREDYGIYLIPEKIAYVAVLASATNNPSYEVTLREEIDEKEEKLNASEFLQGESLCRL